MAFKKLEPYNDWEGKRKFADAGTSQGEKKPMFKCECGGKVVWVKSAKSGKNYLANCSLYDNKTGDTETFWYAAYSPHFKTCDEQAQQRAAMVQNIDRVPEPTPTDEEPF